MIGYSHPARHSIRPWTRRTAFATLAGIMASATLGLAPGATGIAAAAPVNPFPSTLILDDTTNVDSFKLSSDGLWVVYLTTGGQIRSVPAAGGRVRQISIGFGHYEISPDGSRIVYGDAHHLYSVPIASGAPVTTLVDDPAHDILTWNITGDGQRVFFVINGGANDPTSASLSTISIDGGASVRISPIMPAGQGVEYAQPSPDGRWIAYTADQDTNDVKETYVAPIGGGAVVKANLGLPAANYFSNEWSADSMYLGLRMNAPVPVDLYSWSVIDHSTRAMTSGPLGHTLANWTTNGDSVISVVASGASKVMRRVRFDGAGSATLAVTTGVISIKNVFDSNIVYTDTATSSLYLQALNGSPASVLDNVNALTSSSVIASFSEDRVFWTGGDTRVHSTTIPMTGPIGATVISGNLAFAQGQYTTATSPLVYREDTDLRVSDPTATNSTLSILPSRLSTAAVRQATRTADGRRVVYLMDNQVDEKYDLYVAQPTPSPTNNTSKYVPLTPFRALDTRIDGPQLNYVGPKPVGGQTVQLKVQGLPGIPDNGDVKAVVLNVTATNTDGSGFVTVYPNGQPRPLASSLNLTTAGQTRPNLVTVQVGTGGIVNLFTLTGADLVVDVQGFYQFAVNSTDGRFFPLPPARMLDTRIDGPQVGFTGPKPGIGTTFDLQVRGRGGVPVTGVSAVVLNVAATDSSAAGFVTVWPAGLPRPLAANLNLVRAGQTISNQVIVPVGVDGKVSFFTQNGTHLVADVAGWFTNSTEGTGSSGLFVPTAPVRKLDTRADGPQVGYTGGKPGAGAVVDVQWLGIAQGVSAVVMNVTVVEATQSGFITAYPNGTTRPLAANVNAEANDTIGNHSTVKVGQPEEFVQLFTQNGGHLVVDVVGHYTS